MRSHAPRSIWLACCWLLLAELAMLTRGLTDPNVTEGFTLPELGMFSVLFLLLAGLPIALLLAGVRWSRDLYIALYGFTLYYAFAGVGPPITVFESIYFVVKLVAILILFRRTAREWLEPAR